MALLCAVLRRDGSEWDRYLTSHSWQDLGADDRKDTWHGALRVCGSLESRREDSGEWRPPADETMRLAGAGCTSIGRAASSGGGASHTAGGGLLWAGCGAGRYRYRQV